MPIVTGEEAVMRIANAIGDIISKIDSEKKIKENLPLGSANDGIRVYHQGVIDGLSSALSSLGLSDDLVRGVRGG